MTLLAQLGEALPERYYLGLDVGYREHVAVVISLQTFVRGKERWQHARSLHFESTSSGLAKLQRYLDRYSPDPTTFLGLCEPTGGYYGVVVFEYLQGKGYLMFWVENATTRHMRQQIFGDLPKTDEVDSRVMARIGYLHEAVGAEFTLRPVQLARADDSDLLALCRLNWKLTVMINRAQNQLAQVLAAVFPELKTFFKDSVATIAPVSLVAAYRTPAELAAADAAEVATVLHRAGAHQHAQRVAELQELAAHSAGVLPNQGRAWRLEWLTDFLQENLRDQAALDKHIAQLVTARSDYPLLATIPYSGPGTIGTILAATGSIARFGNYRQYVAYSGYFAGLEKSQTIDHTRMSKKGNRDLRRALFQIVAPLCWFDKGENPYKTLYERKKAEGRGWYKAMPFACAALARHIYHCLKSGEAYDVTKTFAASQLPPAARQATRDLGAEIDGQFELMDAYLDSSEAEPSLV
jgi:transposase